MSRVKRLSKLGAIRDVQSLYFTLCYSARYSIMTCCSACLLRPSLIFLLSSMAPKGVFQLGAAEYTIITTVTVCLVLPIVPFRSIWTFTFVFSSSIIAVVIIKLLNMERDNTMVCAAPVYYNLHWYFYYFPRLLMEWFSIMQTVSLDVSSVMLYVMAVRLW